MWRLGAGWGLRRKNTLKTEPWRKPGKKFNPPDTPLEFEKRSKVMEPGIHWKTGFAKKMLEDHYRRIGGAPKKNQLNLRDHQGTPVGQVEMDRIRQEAWQWAAVIDEIEEWETHKEPFAHEAFVSEFICWLQGKSKYNHPNITPWGYQRLHGDTIKQFVLDFVMKKTDYALELQKLKADPQPPTKIEDAWIYWKYLVSTLDVEEALHGTNYNLNPPVDFSFDEGYLPDMEYWLRSRQDPEYYKSIQRNFWHADQEYPFGATPDIRSLNRQLPKEYRDPVTGKSPPGFPVGDRGLNCGETPDDTTVQNGRYYRGAADRIVVDEEELEEEHREVEEQQEQLHEQEDEEYFEIDAEMEEEERIDEEKRNKGRREEEEKKKKKDYVIVDFPEGGEEEEEVSPPPSAPPKPPPKHNGPLKTKKVVSDEKRRENAEIQRQIDERDHKRSQTHPNEEFSAIVEADRLRAFRGEDPIFVPYPEDETREKTSDEIDRDEIEKLQAEVHADNRRKEDEEREKEQKRKEDEEKKIAAEKRKKNEEERKKKEEEERKKKEERQKEDEDLKKLLGQRDEKEEQEKKEKEQRRKEEEEERKRNEEEQKKKEDEKKKNEEVQRKKKEEDEEREQRRKQDEDLKKLYSQRETEEEREEREKEQKRKQDENLKKEREKKEREEKEIKAREERERKEKEEEEPPPMPKPTPTKPPPEKKKTTTLPLPQESEIFELRDMMKNELQPPPLGLDNRSYELAVKQHTENQRKIWSEFNKYVREHEVPVQDNPRKKDFDLLEKQRELMELDTTTKGIALDAAMASMLVTEMKYAKKGIEQTEEEISKYTDMELGALIQRMYVLKALGQEYKEAVGPDHDIFKGIEMKFYQRSIRRITQMEREISKREKNNPHYSAQHVGLKLLMKNKADLTDDDKRLIDMNAEDAKLKGDNGMYIAWTKKLQGTFNAKRVIHSYLLPYPNKTTQPPPTKTPTSTPTTTQAEREADRKAVEEHNKKQEEEKLQRQEQMRRNRDEEEKKEKRKLEQMEKEEKDKREAERLQNLEMLKLQQENEKREREREKKEYDPKKEAEGKEEAEEKKEAEGNPAEEAEYLRKSLEALLHPKKSAPVKKQTTTPSVAPPKKYKYTPPSQQDNPNNMTKDEIFNISTNDKYVKNVLGPKKEDLYYVLGFDKDVSPAKLKKGSHKIALQFHTDKIDAELKPETRKVLNEVRQTQTAAAEILNDPLQRAFYDMGQWTGQGNKILDAATTGFINAKGGVDSYRESVKEFTSKNDPTEEEFDFLLTNITQEINRSQKSIEYLNYHINKAKSYGFPQTERKIIEERIDMFNAMLESLRKKQSEMVAYYNKKLVAKRSRSGKGWFGWS